MVHLPDTTVLIVGVGGSGNEASKLCAAFGMRVLDCDPRTTALAPGMAELFTPDVLPDRIGEADFVLVTVPESPDTVGMFNAALFARMQPGAYFINISRGGAARCNPYKESVTVTANIFQAALDLLDVGGPAAFATVVSAEGFVPVSATSKLLVTATGTLLGQSGSDVVDADIRTEVQRVMAQAPHSPGEFRVLAQDAVASGWYRSWTVELLIEPVHAQGQEILRALVALQETGHRATLATILTEHARFPPGRRKLLVCDNGTTVGRLGDARLEAAVQHRGQEVLLGERCCLEDYHAEDDSTLRLLLEPILPTPTLWVFGGGHIVPTLVRAATLTGFRVRVIDDDPAFANQERFPEAHTTSVMPFTQVGQTFDVGQDDYVVLMTRGHAHDHTIMEQIYDCPARYLGILGSKTRIAKLWQDLEAKGVARQWLDRVHAPIGLNMQARSPEEIGISILAQLIHVRRTSPVVIPQRQRRLR